MAAMGGSITRIISYISNRSLIAVCYYLLLWRRRG